MRLYCPKSTPQDKFERLDCCFLHAVTLSVIYLVTDARENVIYLFYTSNPKSSEVSNS